MYGRESWATDLVAAGVAVLAGYGFSTWDKASTNPLFPLIGKGAAGIAGVGARHILRNPYAHAAAGAIGIAGFGAVGQWMGEATTTLGNKGPGAAPVYLPQAASKSANAARIAAARAQAAAVARAQADIVQPLQPSPGSATEVYQYPHEQIA